MVKKTEQQAADYIVPLDINGMQGRMLHMPPPKGKSKEILFVYGHHSSLERWWGLAQVLNTYGAVTMPDLPGFGGMDSFYTIGKQPTIDNFADYLAAFIKLRYKRKKCVIAGMSFGFIIVTRMLQRYPEMTKHVEMVVSVAGFAHRDDFIIPRPWYNLYRLTGYVFAHRAPAFLFSKLFFNSFVLRQAYKIDSNRKMKGHDPEVFERMLAMEVSLWRINDWRTAAVTIKQFLEVDNCQVQVHLPIYHVGMKGDQYFDNYRVEQHLRIIFDDFHLMALVDAKHHAPSVIATKQETWPFVPVKLRRVLNKL